MNTSSAAIRQAVSHLLPTLTVEILEQVDSSNSELMRRARSGLREPVLLVARRQSAGRGRLGRTWHSETDSETHNLTFSLGLPLAPRDWSGLSLAVGLAVAESLHPALRLKWPNDIYLDGRKLAGILIETASMGELRYAIIGIGMNITLPPALSTLSAQELPTAPAALVELLPTVDAAQALLRITPPLVASVLCFETQGFAPLRAAFQARDVLYDREVVCSDGTSGVARGVDALGALLIQTTQGVHKLTSAEVSIRPSTPAD
ncbi:MAG: biotin--[acetyl-CoA-carboxylase] ligase [Rhodoferax sp.]|nr:biotin--[acetyl-CoA-carboxylase] ligase [Rhodoferax sp.]